MQVTVEVHPKPFSLLTPTKVEPRSGRFYNRITRDSNDIFHILNSARQSEVLAIDLETRGTDPSLEDNYVVGIGLAWNRGSAYIDWLNISSADQEEVRNCILEHQGLIAHNVYFDGSWLYQELGGRHPTWLVCTYGLYKHLATEGFEGQRWGLKDAQIDLLGWESTNEVELDAWLVENGYKKQNGAPIKAEMWRAPVDILGKYCCLDAESCYLLYTEVLAPAYTQHSELVTYHHVEFLHLVRVLIEQKFHGMQMDVEKLQRHQEGLASAIENARLKFLHMPEVAPHVKQWELERLAEHEAKEPARLKKNGEVSKNWEKWEARRQEIAEGRNKKYRFNIGSGTQLRYLLYEKLGYRTGVVTASGLDGTNEDALKQMGHVGAGLISYSELVKEQTYVQAYLETLRNSNRSTLHPSFRCPGTLTGRLSGREPNIQQIPKSRGTLECFVARPGHVLVDCDINSLEQVVLCELSRDRALMRIYGPGAPPNDVYLFIGSQLPVIGEEIRAAGYDPDRPTREGIAEAKHRAKGARAIAKVVVLASSYGAGAKKLLKTLRLNGVEISEYEVEDIHRSYWELHKGVRQYGVDLMREWKINHGWVYNGLGRPIGVAEDYTKDLVNRVVQSTGHDVLVKYIYILVGLLGDLPWKPYIMDWHDEVILEVPEKYADRILHIMEKDAFRELNSQLGGIIPLKGSGKICHTLADAKLED